jgi:FSR family fosmidomycin resistance protein-like MFS transporter
MSTPTTLDAAQARDPRSRILGLISLCHCLNDMMQSLILASYPLLKQNHGLSFTQIGLLTLTYQCTSSLLQRCNSYRVQ